MPRAPLRGAIVVRRPCLCGLYGAHGSYEAMRKEGKEGLWYGMVVVVAMGVATVQVCWYV